MSTTIITAWIDNEVQSIEVSNTAYVAPTPLLPSITLLGGEKYWHEHYDKNNNHIGYYQTISEVSNGSITVRSKIDLQPSPEQLAAFYEKDITFTVVNEDGIATVYTVGVRPEQDYIIQCTITEVAING